MVKTEKTPSQRAVDWLNKKTEPAEWPQWATGALLVILAAWLIYQFLFSAVPHET